MSSRPKKILYVITKSVWGGAQRYVYDLATHAAAEGHDVAVACGGTGPLLNALQQAHIRVISIPMLERDVSIGKEVRVFTTLLALFRRERPDVIHLNSSKVGGVGAVAARLVALTNGRSTRVLFTVHGWPFFEPRPYHERALIFLTSWVSTLFQQAVILISARDYRASRWFIPEGKAVLIQHGIAPIQFSTREEARTFLARRTGAAIRSDTIVLAATGELTRNKGLDYALMAMARVKSSLPNHPCHLLIMGEGEERQPLLDRIRALGLEQSVSLAGFVPDARRYLTGADIFIMPSLKEGLPYAIMEAMAAGLPVIATSVGGIPDLIEPGIHGMLVPPRDERALAEAITTLITEPDLRHAYGSRARQRAEQTFKMEAMTARTFALYDQ